MLNIVGNYNLISPEICIWFSGAMPG